MFWVRPCVRACVRACMHPEQRCEHDILSFTAHTCTNTERIKFSGQKLKGQGHRGHICGHTQSTVSLQSSSLNIILVVNCNRW